MKIETLALQGKIRIAHSHSHIGTEADAVGGNSFDIQVINKEDKLMIGTTAHADEMAELVGSVMAAHLKHRVDQGSYVCKLSPVEIMGLRGSLVTRIENLHQNDFSEKPAAKPSRPGH